MLKEAALFRAAAEAGVPVPELLDASDDPSILGSSFLVCAHVDGETIPRKILRDPEFAEARPKLARQCGEVLARLHSIDPSTIEGLEDQDQVAQYRGVLDNLAEPHPTFELAFKWLEANRPAGNRHTVVHGDFRNGNLIIGPDGLRAVIDWELAHTGDPMEDLGWLCVKSWRFGVVDRVVGGFGDVDTLLGFYERAGGRRVTPEELRFWIVLGTLKWGVICIAQCFTHLNGVVRSVELATLGRRVAEMEWDILAVLDGGW
jgi:aminoglycoside phosphotransferase (APT) family kinase protein